MNITFPPQALGISFAQTKTFLVSSISIITLLLTTPSLANAISATEGASPAVEAAVATDRVSYQPDFFEEFSPNTAFDMVNQVPGFSLQGESNNRGFSQGQGNFLVNGKRPSTKDTSAHAILNRIPASNILRIEVLKEGSSELAGQTGLIVNVITTEDSSLKGSWGLNGYWMETGDKFVPFGRFSVVGKTGKLGFTAEVNINNDAFEEGGIERVLDASRALTQLRDEYFKFKSSNDSISLGLNYKTDKGSEANLNVKGVKLSFDMAELSEQFAPNATGGLGLLNNITDFAQHESKYNYEVSGDYSLPLGSGTLKFIGLRSMEDSKINSDFSELPSDNNDYHFMSTRNPVETETILRTTYTWAPAKGQTLEWAIEGVKNGLDTVSTFAEDTGAGFENVTLDGSDTIVTEKRAETSLLYSRPLSDRLSMIANVAVEYSELAVTGPDAKSRAYTRPKGFVALNYKLSDKTTLKGRFERKVGQLQFGVFASELNLQEGTTNNGNTGIVPEQTWRTEATVEHRFGKDNVISLTADYNIINDRVENIPFGDGSEGFGNIDKAKRYGLSMKTTLMTEDWGLEGGRINLKANVSKSSMIDPVTGVTRGFDNFQDYFGSLSFIHNIPKTDYTWGFSVLHWSGQTSHRIGERTKNSSRGPSHSNIFVRHNDILGMKLEWALMVPFGRKNTTVRTFYAPDRNGAYDGEESRVRNSGIVTFLKLSSTF